MTDSTQTSVRTRKRELRSELRHRRRALTDATDRSARIAVHVLALAPWAEARTVLTYLAMAEEVQTEPLIQAALAQGKRLCLPRLDGDGRMSVVRVDDLSTIDAADSRWKIRQPATGAGEVLDPAAIDLALLPCVGVDRACGRLGLGGGHIDRLLAQLRPEAVTLGLVFECQVVDELPREPHDRPLTGFVTEEGRWQSQCL